MNVNVCETQVLDEIKCIVKSGYEDTSYAFENISKKQIKPQYRIDFLKGDDFHQFLVFYKSEWILNIQINHDFTNYFIFYKNIKTKTLSGDYTTEPVKNSKNKKYKIARSHKRLLLLNYLLQILLKSKNIY